MRDLKRRALTLADDLFLLRRLYFDDMYTRVENVTDAAEGTFDGFLKDHNAPMTLWQTTRISAFFEDRNGIFFLSGKPGSGKSTLMKFLLSGHGQRKAQDSLQKWAGQKRLIRVSMMFLLHGTPLQRSLEGFYRTIFFELLCQFPRFMEILFPDQSTEKLSDEFHSSFRLETLQEAWERLLSIRNHDTIKICLFIDGLDELEGNSADRLKFALSLTKWAESDDIKIICSGRPNAEFNIVFNQPHRRIELQDLTMPDIRKILRKTFVGIRRFSDLTAENVEELVNDISKQSEGVILWAVLVGKSLEDDAIHGKSLSAMKRTIQRFPSGIEDLFDGIWQTLDAHQQLMLQTIYDLTVLSNEIMRTIRPLPALCLYWLEEVLADDGFPYNQPIRALSALELNSRLDKVRVQMKQYTKHLIEVPQLDSGDDSQYLYERCRYVHRSAEEFIQSKLGFLGLASVRSKRTFELYLRLLLILEMSVQHEGPEDGFTFFLNLPLICPEEWQSPPQVPTYQLPFRMMEKLRETMSVRHDSVSKGNAAEKSVDYVWKRRCLPCYDGNEKCVRRTTYSFFHLALRSHQFNFITRKLEDNSRELVQKDASLGLLICVVGRRPNYELCQLLLDHGANPGSLVEVYRTRRERNPELKPIWVLFFFYLASSLASQSGVVAPDRRKKPRSAHFLILEHFLRLGYGTNVKFLAAPIDSYPEPEEADLFGVDLAQLIRLAKPDNMDRLLSLLEPPSATFLNMVQKLINFILQPQFPFHTLPHEAIVTPYTTVSDEYLNKEEWEIWGAFDGEHQVVGRCHFYTPE